MNDQKLNSTEGLFSIGWREIDTKKVKEEQKNKQSSTDRVAVILGYYDGNKYLIEQLDSIINQTHRNIGIFISDDYSPEKPDTSSLTLKEEQSLYIKCNEVNQGFCKNFLNALTTVNDGFEYFAFSDQDDIWNSDKIERALNILSQYPSDKPALYASSTTIVGECGQLELGTSPIFKKPPSFANALVQNIGGGNTMVFNQAAKDLIAKSSMNIDIVSHDWWCYQIVSGAGGMVHYDPEPCLKYRQHPKSLVGSNNSPSAKIVRIKALLDGRFCHWNDINLRALSNSKNLLTDKSKQTLEGFIRARQANIFKRLILFWRTGIYRQTTYGTLSLMLGLLINKV